MHDKIACGRLQILQKYKVLLKRVNLCLASEKGYALFNLIEMKLIRYPVRISLVTFLVSIASLAYFQSEITKSLSLASFGSIFVALTYRLGQANYHKNLFEDRFAIFNILDEVMREWVVDTKATREMVTKLDNVMRKSYCLFSNQTYQFIKNFRMAIIKLVFCIDSAPDRDEIIAARQFLISLVENENLSKMFPELKIDSY